MAMQEKEVFDDVLASQKFITEMYNTYFGLVLLRYCQIRQNGSLCF